MTIYQDTPRVGPFRVGADFRLNFYVRNQDTDTAIDFTGATAVSVVFTPEIASDAAFTNTGALSADPTAEPQFYVDVADTDTAGMTQNQTVNVVATVTNSDATKDIVGAAFNLI